MLGCAVLFCPYAVRLIRLAMQQVDNITASTGRAVGEKKAISSLYVLKAIFALIVVAIHTPPFEHDVDKGLFAPLGIVAVPIFYAITGYFLYTPDRDKLRIRAQTTFRKVLISYVGISAYYAVLHLFVAPNNYELTWSNILEFLVHGMTFEGALWYVHALLYTLVFYWLVARFSLQRLLPYLAVVMLLLGLLLGRYSFLLGSEGTILLDFNAISVAIPYVTLGYFVKRYEEILLRIKWELPLLLLFFLNLLEVFVLKGSVSYWGRFAFTLPFALAIMCFALQHKSFGEGSFTAACGNRYSGLIYYLHFTFIYFMRFFIDKVCPIDIYYREVGFVYVFLMTLGLAWLVDKLQARLGYKII